MKRAFRGGPRSETLKPDPATELPLTPPAEEDDEDAAISLLVEFSLHCREKEQLASLWKGDEQHFILGARKASLQFSKKLAPSFSTFSNSIIFY